MLERRLKPRTKTVEIRNGEKISLEVFEYSFGVDPSRIANAIGKDGMRQMAKVYKEAFGGEPWFEVGECVSCGEFFKVDFGNCNSCGVGEIKEAYPENFFTGEYFLSMLGEFSPGILIVAKNEKGEIIGFTTGGERDFTTLILKKYKSQKSPESILNFISEKFKINRKDVVWYDNETCILPDLQKSGIGKVLSRERMEIAKESGKSIVGRSINVEWLKTKREQAKELGLSFEIVVPDEDKYEVDGNKRFFYVAKSEQE